MDPSRLCVALSWVCVGRNSRVKTTALPPLFNKGGSWGHQIVNVSIESFIIRSFSWGEGWGEYQGGIVGWLLKFQQILVHCIFKDPRTPGWATEKKEKGKKRKGRLSTISSRGLESIRVLQSRWPKGMFVFLHMHLELSKHAKLHGSFCKLQSHQLKKQHNLARSVYRASYITVLTM